MMFEEYTITDDAVFDIQRYPQVESEIVAMSAHIRNLTGNHKSEVVISFLKDHCIKTSLLTEHDEVFEMIRSGSIHTDHTEKLFSACKHNRGFLSSFEQYISTVLK